MKWSNNEDTKRTQNERENFKQIIKINIKRTKKHSHSLKDTFGDSNFHAKKWHAWWIAEINNMSSYKN